MWKSKCFNKQANRALGERDKWFYSGKVEGSGSE